MYEGTRRRYSSMVLTSFGLTLVLYLLLQLWIALVYPAAQPTGVAQVLDSAPAGEAVHNLPVF